MRDGSLSQASRTLSKCWLKVHCFGMPHDGSSHRGEFELPSLLVEAAYEQGRAAWLDDLPAIVASLAERFAVLVGPPFQPGGTTSFVAPARRGDEDVVLKVLWPHVEAEQEFDALSLWAGEGAVRLLDVAADENFRAGLLERCLPGSSLKEEPEETQDVVVAGLLRRLWRTGSQVERYRPLRSMCEEWAEEYEQRDEAARASLDSGLAREGISLFRELASSPTRDVLLVTDLHAENILSAEREPWLVVDPKPHVGDPHYDVLQHMLNCPGRLAADPVALADRMAVLTDLDASRVRSWLFARCVVDSPFDATCAEAARTLARRRGVVS